MAANTIPNNAAGIIGQATDMLAGLVSLGTFLGITQITPTTFGYALNDYMACEAAFNAFRSSEQAASTTWRESMAALDEWLEMTRGVLTGRFGWRWSPLWVQAGFNNNSTAVPAKIDDRLTLAYSLATFFTAHTSYEVASMQVTAARATTLRNAALAARSARATIEVNKQGQWVTRGDSRDSLVGLMRGLIKILGATIGKLDPQWLAFGLQMPGAETTPGQPVNVVVGLDFTGAISAQCDAVPLAKRYRWRMRIVGIETAYELVARSVAPTALIAPVAPGTVVEIIVQGVNGNSQGVASVPVLFTMPALAVAPAPEAAPKQAAARSGHGEHNGNGKGHAALARH